MSTAPFRPLPALDDQNSFFWTSGSDGQLRFQRCQGCGYYLHPPSPRCPGCGGRDIQPEPVSGRGQVLTFTVNHQAWDGHPDPYVIAIVEMEEQAGLRLTTNIIGCPADAVMVGMPVEVEFEHHGEVWVPFFHQVEATS